MTEIQGKNVLALHGLQVGAADGTTIVDDVSVSLHEGEILGLVGESGSGKTTTALALLGYATAGTRVMAGSLTIGGRRFDSLDAVKAVRGKLISYIPQTPGTALNPSLRIGDALEHMLAQHKPKNAESSTHHERVLSQVGLPSTTEFIRRFPHQLSGGQQQRVCTAIAITGMPPVIVLDEPTTGLDVITQAKVLTELRRLRDEENVAMLYVTHDLAAIAQIADRIAVMSSGRIVELGTTEDVLTRPQHPYTANLVASVLDHRNPITLHERKSSRPSEKVSADSTPVLELEELRAVHRGRKGTVVAAERVSFSIDRGEIVALVGESGSGKSTIARTIAGLHPLDSGAVRLAGQQLPNKARKRTAQQRRDLQFVFQNPWEALNPQETVAECISRPLRVLRGMSREEAAHEVDALLGRVRLSPSLRNRYPSELSGGQRQRVVIARALAPQPKLLICDEITSALDVSVQAAVLKVLLELSDELNLSILFITHDLGVVSAIADRLLVLQKGLICEQGDVSSVMVTPKHPYTQKLVAAAPSLAVGVPKSRDTTATVAEVIPDQVENGKTL